MKYTWELSDLTRTDRKTFGQVVKSKNEFGILSYGYPHKGEKQRYWVTSLDDGCKYLDSATKEELVEELNEGNWEPVYSLTNLRTLIGKV